MDNKYSKMSKKELQKFLEEAFDNFVQELEEKAELLDIDAEPLLQGSWMMMLLLFNIDNEFDDDEFYLFKKILDKAGIRASHQKADYRAFYINKQKMITQAFDSIFELISYFPEMTLNLLDLVGGIFIYNGRVTKEEEAFYKQFIESNAFKKIKGKISKNDPQVRVSGKLLSNGELSFSNNFIEDFLLDEVKDFTFDLYIDLPNELISKTNNYKSYIDVEGYSNMFPGGMVTYAGSIVALDVCGDIVIDGKRYSIDYDFKVGFNISEEVEEEFCENYLSIDVDMSDYDTTSTGIVIHCKVTIESDE